MNPKISIVIVNFNYGRFIEATIKSIVEQKRFDQCELIVVDGGSRDNSVEVIKKYAEKISWWCSEPDKGQSDAFNKGFSHARGKLGCWVNADDLLLPGTLDAVLREIEKNPNVEWVTGGTIFFNNEGKMWKARIGTSITKHMHKWVDPTVIGGPSCFFSLERLRQVGGFNVKLRYTMDGDLWNHFFAAGMRMVHVNRYFWGFRMHEASKTSHALRGEKKKDFIDEDEIVFSARNYTPAQMRRAGRALMIYKILNLSLVRSLIDTFMFSGKSIYDFK